jgi:hypothetical protein
MKQHPLLLTGIILCAVAGLAGSIGYQLGQKSSLLKGPGSPLDFANRLISRLELTPEQQLKLEPELAHAEKEVKAAARDAMSRAQAVRARLHDAVRPLLTAQQANELDQLRAEQDAIRQQVERMAADGAQ